ncbi:hypothetical protein ABTI52_19735, partial [Acinetobacter baumannii]
RQMKKVLRIHGCAKQSLERLAARILHHQSGPTCLDEELKRTDRPRGIQVFSQMVFVGQAI